MCHLWHQMLNVMLKICRISISVFMVVCKIHRTHSWRHTHTGWIQVMTHCTVQAETVNLINDIKCVWSQWPSLMNVTAINDHIYFSFSVVQRRHNTVLWGSESRPSVSLFFSPLSSLETLSIARNILIMMTKNRRMFLSQRANQQQHFVTDIYMHVWRWESQTLHWLSQMYNCECQNFS